MQFCINQNSYIRVPREGCTFVLSIQPPNNKNNITSKFLHRNETFLNAIKRVTQFNIDWFYIIYVNRIFK